MGPFDLTYATDGWCGTLDGTRRTLVMSSRRSCCAPWCSSMARSGPQEFRTNQAPSHRRQEVQYGLAAGVESGRQEFQVVKWQGPPLPPPCPPAPRCPNAARRGNSRTSLPGTRDVTGDTQLHHLQKNGNEGGQSPVSAEHHLPVNHSTTRLRIMNTAIHCVIAGVMAGFVNGAGFPAAPGGYRRRLARSGPVTMIGKKAGGDLVSGRWQAVDIEFKYEQK